MRVGLVCPYDMGKPGGVQSQVRGLAETLEATGDVARIIAPGPAQGRDGVSVGGSIPVPANRSRAPLALDPRVIRRVRAAAGDLDLLHVHEPLMPLVSLAALRAGPPVVATFHAAPSWLGRAVYRVTGSRLRSLLGQGVHCVTAVSDTAADVIPPDLLTAIVPNGIDVGAFQADVARIPQRVAFIGRDEPRKGLDVLVEAWKEVVGVVPSAELVVMGASRDIDGITWVHPVTDSRKASILSSSAIYVAPSLGGESFGVVLVEGMAAGAAVVASGLDSYRSVAGDAAVFFATGSASDLATTLIALLEDEPRRRELADKGRARAARFDWTVVGASYRTLYQEALS